MARTIRDLERLVAEAVELAETAGAPVDRSLPDETRQHLSRRPTLGLAKKISQYLEDVSSKINDTDPTENSESPKSNSAPPESPLPQDKKETEVETRRCQGACSADNLVVLPPEPIAEPWYEKKTELLRGRASAEASSKSPRVTMPFLSPPQIGPRTTSARQDNESRYPTSPTPAIQLNGDELKVHFEEDKEPLLRAPKSGHERHFSQMFGVPSRHVSINMAHPAPYPDYKIDLNGTRHVDIAKSPDDLNVHRTCHHAPVARNWPSSRKRFAAWMSCINTACVGILIGIYAGEVPAIQYVIVDINRQIILGNVFLYVGLAISTLIFWPLPLLHGRKPYTLVSLASALCLQIPQGVMVLSFRDPDVQRYRITLLLSRGLSGFALGFANINNFATLLDVFGASLQSDESEEQGSPYDVRRHGGGMGLWLGIWSSCSVGTISIGFLIGAIIINGTSVDWGFWISSLLLMFVTLLNVMAPEVRRSAFRRTIAEITGEGGSFSRVARGEIKFHLTGNGPYWWGEEILAGIRLSWRMVKQPGFLVLSVYGAWVYAQFILVIMVSFRQ
jgi:MFS family permease